MAEQLGLSRRLVLAMAAAAAGGRTTVVSNLVDPPSRLSGGAWWGSEGAAMAAEAAEAGGPVRAAGKEEQQRKRVEFERLPGGVQVLDIRTGTGAAPQLGDKVAIHYHARLVAKQGWTFDSTYEHLDAGGVPEPFEFVVGSGEVIGGLTAAVLGMREGGTRRAIIPPAQGYQSTNDQPIPPNFSSRQRLFTTIFNPTRISNGEGSTLGTVLFDIQLLRIRRPQ